MYLFSESENACGLDIGDQFLKIYQTNQNKKKPQQDFALSLPLASTNNTLEQLEFTNQLLNENRNKIPNKASMVCCLNFPDVTVRSIRIPKAFENEIEKLLIWELSETFPFQADSYQIRYNFVGEMKERDGVRDEYIVMVVKNEIINAYVNLLESNHLKPGGLDFEPLALARFLIDHTKNNEEDIKGLLNIQNQYSSFVIVRHNRIAFIKKIDYGLKHFDEAIANSLRINSEDAKLKRESWLSPFSKEDQSLLGKALEPLQKSIHSYLRYFAVNFRSEYVQSLYITGKLEIPRLKETLQEYIGVNCTIPSQDSDLNSQNKPLHDLPFWAKAKGQSLKESIKN